MNFWLVLITGLIPLAVGFVYYSKAVVGKAWMNVNGFTDSDLEGGNMALTFGLSYIGGILISLIVLFMVIHQMGLFSVLATEPGFDDPNSAVGQYFAQFNEQYGTKHRSFGHGFMHGSMSALLLVGSVIMTNALFEKRGFKYILIHTIYWVITLGLIGGVLCQFF
ncbi:MAG: DUF1761 domain-containing protein [Bacteroidota bacterium]